MIEWAERGRNHRKRRDLRGRNGIHYIRRKSWFGSWRVVAAADGKGVWTPTWRKRDNSPARSCEVVQPPLSQSLTSVGKEIVIKCCSCCWTRRRRRRRRFSHRRRTRSNGNRTPTITQPWNWTDWHRVPLMTTFLTPSRTKAAPWNWRRHHVPSQEQWPKMLLLLLLPRGLHSALRHVSSSLQSVSCLFIRRCSLCSVARTVGPHKRRRRSRAKGQQQQSNLLPTTGRLFIERKVTSFSLFFFLISFRHVVASSIYSIVLFDQNRNFHKFGKLSWSNGNWRVPV